MNRLLSTLYFCCTLYAGIAQTPELEIWQIQGENASSPYQNDEVTSLSNVVTAVGSDRFFIQTPNDRTDNNVMTSDGMMVYTGNEPDVLIGDLVNVTGTVKEYEGLTEFSNSGLNYEVVDDNQSLPDVVLLDNNFPQGVAMALPELERVEGMYVRFEDGLVTGPSNFYGTTYVNAGGTRTFREPGIAYPGVNGFPIWDKNPEVFLMDVYRLLGDSPDLFSGTVVSGEGVMSFADYNYVLYATSYTAGTNMTGQEVRPKTSEEYTVGNVNTYVFSAGDNDYQIRLTKLAKYVVEGMRTPHIVAMQEVESFAVINDLAERIAELYPGQESYVPHLLGVGSGSFSIQVGFLVNETLTDVNVVELGTNEYLSSGGTLHDRPPLLLEAKLPTNPPIPISVLNVHLRSLNGIEGSNSDFVRLKRHEQAVSVANMINARLDENLIIVGDFNAYQFSDGYVDVFNQISGLPTQGSMFSVETVIDPSLMYYNTWLPNEQQYSYVYRGNSQMIDHCLSTDLSGIQATDMAFVRGNCDRADGYTNNTNPFGVSDHDGFVLYLQPDEISTSIIELASDNRLSYPNPFQIGSTLSFTIEKEDDLSLRLYTLDGQLFYEKNIGFYPKGEHTIQPGFSSANGLYIMRLSGSSFDFNKKIFIIAD